MIWHDFESETDSGKMAKLSENTESQTLNYRSENSPCES